MTLSLFKTTESNQTTFTKTSIIDIYKTDIHLPKPPRDNSSVTVYF